MNFIGTVKMLAKQSGKFITAHSPTLLTIAGSGGVITSVIFAAKATPKAMKLIERRKQELRSPNIPFKEKAKACWKVYLPTACMTATSIGCFVGANTIGLRRNAALASLYATTEHTLREYQKQVIETVGEEAEKTIHDKTAQKLMETSDQPKLSGDILVGDELCYDEFSGQTFRSDANVLARQESEILRILVSTMYISCNDVYDIMGLKPPLLGDDKGWTIDDDFHIRVRASHGEDGKLRNIVTFSCPPHDNYYRMY